MRLTDLAVQKLPLLEKGQKTCWDEALPAFGIRIGTRSKSFIVMFGRRRQLITIGRYPEISLADARKLAKRHLATYTEKTAPRGYFDAVEGYLAECRATVRSKTLSQYIFYLKGFQFDGNLSDITRADILTRYTSPHAITTFKIFFNWALRNDYIGKNPLAGERVVYNPSRTRVLTYEELKKVWAYDYPPFSDIIKLLILTGQRRTEIGSLKASWILDGIVFPPEITKNKREHTLPYGYITRPYLKPYDFKGWSKAKARLDKHVKIAPWTLHDLRRTFATIHAEIGTPIHVTEKLLNHVSGSHAGIVGIYQRHTHSVEMKIAVETYEQHLAKILSL